MKPLLAFIKKEYLEAARTGKITILALLFVLFGILNPAIAKMTPWIMEMLSDTLAEDGLIFTDIQVDALTSWTQFFKNLPVALIAFVLIFSDIFTKEYKSGTLLLVLTKGLSRLILSRLVDTFISRISLTMLPVPNPHNTVCVLSWEEARHWQSRSSGYSSS